MDPDPGGPKTRGSGGSGSATLPESWTLIFDFLTFITFYVGSGYKFCSETGKHYGFGSVKVKNCNSGSGSTALYDLLINKLLVRKER